MVDINSFWESLKCTWVRRILSTDAFWPKILEKNLSIHSTNINKILFAGPSQLNAISKKLNPFWKNLLMCLANLENEASFALTESFSLMPLFNNPLFKNGRRALKRSNFGNPGHGIEQVANVYKTSCQLYSLEELNVCYGTTMTGAQLQSIHGAILGGLASLNLNLGNCTWHPEPRQSLIIQIAARNKRGCRGFYNTFRAKANHRNLTRKYEQKWHNELGCSLSIDFWNKCWKLHASIKNNNRYKWIQCQILRNSLYTNNRVAKFKDNIRDICDLCGGHSERPLTPFFTCGISQQSLDRDN